jgi:hypothetical protein
MPRRQTCHKKLSAITRVQSAHDLVTMLAPSPTQSGPVCSPRWFCRIAYRPVAPYPCESSSPNSDWGVLAREHLGAMASCAASVGAIHRRQGHGTSREVGGWEQPPQRSLRGVRTQKGWPQHRPRPRWARHTRRRLAEASPPALQARRQRARVAGPPGRVPPPPPPPPSSSS